MKQLFTVIIVMAIVATSALRTHASEEVQLQTGKPSVSDNEYLYEITNNEVLVNDQLITLIAFTPKSISASYRNKTDKMKKPKYTIEVYNPYGMLVGSKTLGDSMISFGSSTYMEPGAVSSERIHLKEYPLDKILENTNLILPDDLLQMKWVVISQTNTRKKIEQAESTVPVKAALSANIILPLKSRNPPSIDRLQTKTVVLNERYVRVPYGFSDIQHKKIAELFPDAYIVEIKAYGGKLHAYIADKVEDPSKSNTLSGQVVVIDPQTWKRQDAGTRFSGHTYRSFIANDLEIWTAFLWFAQKTAKQNGVGISRSQKIVFVPGQSFRIEGQKIVLRYFRSHFRAKPSNRRHSGHYATLEIDAVYGLGLAQPENAPDKK